MKSYRCNNVFLTFILTLALMQTAASAAWANSSAGWKSAEGTYVWKESAQYSNGLLLVKPVEDAQFMFEFKAMRGSEAEDSSFEFDTAGIFQVDDTGIGTAEFVVDKETVKLSFTLINSTITVRQNGTMPADVSGDYDYQEKSFEASEAAATAIVRGIAPAKTSLNSSNSPYSLVYADDTIDGWFYEVIAVHQPSGKQFARFLVAADLSAVYRSDSGEAPQLIFGSAESMLNAKTAPLLHEESEDLDEWIMLPEGAELDSRDSETPAFEEESRLSAVVSVGPADPDITVGNSSMLTVSLPGNLRYRLSELKSSASDKVSVDSKGVLTAKSEGMAEITGKLTVDGASRDFKVTVTASVPKP